VPQQEQKLRAVFEAYKWTNPSRDEAGHDRRYRRTLLRIFFMLKLTSKADLQRLIDDGIQESLTLDYKASPALSKDSKPRDELCKDVSALANSAGGQIIYGIEEKDGKPWKIDDGAKGITREWIEQVIDSNVQPRILGLTITPVQLTSGNAFVITVPQSTSRGAHQAPDKKYYKRQNFQSIAMEDYEIRDIMKRATTPDLFVSLTFLNGNFQDLEFVAGEETSRTFELRASIINRSAQPAFHVIVEIGIVTDLRARTFGTFESLGQFDDELGTPMNWFRWSLSSPPALPVFREHPMSLAGTPIVLAVHPQERGLHGIYDLTVKTAAPGFTSTEHWAARLRHTSLTLHPPGSEFAAKPA
jgi:hypothetical protein